MQPTVQTMTLEQPITLTQIVPVVQRLPALDRLRLIRILAEELEVARDIFPLETGRTYSPEVDLFGETEEEIRADEERWEQQFIAGRDKLRTMVREAAAEYHAGRTKPMQFTPEGRLAR